MAKANQKIDKKDLGYLGEDFQIELVKCFIEDQKFFINVESMVNPNHFTNNKLKRIVGFMKDRYALNETVTKYKDLDTLIRGKISNAIDVEECLAMLNTIQNIETRGIDLIEEYSEKFFKQQNLTQAINQAYEIIQKGDDERYNDIEGIIRKAIEASNRKNLGFRIFDNMEDALKEDYRCTIPTGATLLDEAFYGGLGKGELGIIIAPSSVGKTSATTGFAANAAITKTEDNNYKGYKVLHIFFEDEDVNIKRKYYAFLTGYDACDLSLPEIRPRVIEMINQNEWKEMIQNNVIGYHALNGEMSPTDIERFIQRHIAMGFKPDLVIVDYFECLKLEKAETTADTEWTREGSTMRKLEKIAHDYNVAIWCPVQGTKDSFYQEIVGLTQAGGSVKKVQIGHVIISFARTDAMRKEDKINIFINKFRPGRIKANSFMGVTFNNGTTKFDFSTCTDVEVDDALESNQQFSTEMAINEKNSYKK